jgi:hypothetical protein
MKTSPAERETPPIFGKFIDTHFQTFKKYVVLCPPVFVLGDEVFPVKMYEKM